MSKLKIGVEEYNISDHQDAIRILCAFELDKTEEIITIELEDFSYAGVANNYVKLFKDNERTNKTKRR